MWCIPLTFNFQAVHIVSQCIYNIGCEQNATHCNHHEINIKVIENYEWTSALVDLSGIKYERGTVYG